MSELCLVAAVPSPGRAWPYVTRTSVLFWILHKGFCRWFDWRPRGVQGTNLDLCPWKQGGKGDGLHTSVGYMTKKKNRHGSAGVVTSQTCCRPTLSATVCEDSRARDTRPKQHGELHSLKRLAVLFAVHLSASWMRLLCSARRGGLTSDRLLCFGTPQLHCSHEAWNSATCPLPFPGATMR